VWQKARASACNSPCSLSSDWLAGQLYVFLGQQKATVLSNPWTFLMLSLFASLSLLWSRRGDASFARSLARFCVYAVHIIAALVLYFFKKASTRVVTLRDAARVYLFCYLFPWCRVNYWLCLSVCKHTFRMHGSLSRVCWWLFCACCTCNIYVIMCARGSQLPWAHSHKVSICSCNNNGPRAPFGH
jgi:hypothetical protein